MSLSYATNILENYIVLSHPHYIRHTKYIQKMDKPIIYVMIGNEAELIWWWKRMTCYGTFCSPTKNFLRKVMGVLEVLNFSATYFLVSCKLIFYKKEFHSIAFVVVRRSGCRNLTYAILVHYTFFYFGFFIGPWF